MAPWAPIESISAALIVAPAPSRQPLATAAASGLSGPQIYSCRVRIKGRADPVSAPISRPELGRHFWSGSDESLEGPKLNGFKICAKRDESWSPLGLPGPTSGSSIQPLSLLVLLLLLIAEAATPTKGPNELVGLIFQGSLGTRRTSWAKVACQAEVAAREG